MCIRDRTALILEQRIINQHNPRFNRRGKFSQNIYWIKLKSNKTNLEISKIKNTPNTLFKIGPFLSYSKAKKFKLMLNELLNLINCKKNNSRKTKCDISILKDTPCACVESFDINLYIQKLNIEIKLFFDEITKSITKLKEEVGIFSDNLEYEKAQILMKGAHPGNFNQAIMEFGAVKCVPKKPNCQDCIFSSNCIAFQEGKVSLLPVKSKKVKVKDRYLHYFVILDESRNTLIEKRKGKGIWQNLYQFPMIETQKKQEYFDEIEIKSLMLKYKIRADFDITKWNDQPIFHKLTHQHLEINFWIVKLCKKVNLGTQIGLIHNYPMPRVLQKFRDKFFIN